MGRVTHHILVSFAQFERWLAGARIRDKLARAQKAPTTVRRDWWWPAKV
jgi:DNA invertase Pin-like site-specific DNA recombinase